MTLLEAIRAASFIMAKKDVRYFLNGVHIVKKDGVVTVESTDGYIGFQTRDVDADNIQCDELDVIVPRDTIEIVKKAKFLHMEADKFVTDTSTFPFVPVDGNYPQMDRVMPSRNVDVYTGEQYSFNPEYIMAIGKSYRAATGCKGYMGLVSRNVAGGEKGEILSSVLMYPYAHELSRTNWVVMPQRIGA